MEWLFIILGALALIALGARLWQGFIQIDYEATPRLPVIIAIQGDNYFCGWSDGQPVSTPSYKEATTFETVDDYKKTLARLRELGYQPVWKCSPQALKAS
jgi:hypothetical protein